MVEIKHKNDCAPKVLNPEVLKPQPTFEMVDIKIAKNGLLTWTTTNEQEPIPYVVEQFRWNKWVKVGEVNGKGLKKTNTYSFQPVLNSGENKFRIKQVGFQGVEKRSEIVSLKTDIKPLGHSVNKEKSIVSFSDKTLFEIYDAYGSIIEYGYGDSLNINNLSKGFYYLCYDNTVVDFTK